MRRAALLPLAAGALLIAIVPALSQNQPRPTPPPGPAQPQQRPQQQPAPPPQAAPKPYQPVAVGAPPVVSDPGFDAFRKQVGEAARRKDRAALGKLVVAKDFFWLGEKGDKADKKRSGIDNLTRILSLNAKDGIGWEALAGYAADPTAIELPNRKGTICAPADPVFDIKQLENLAKTTGTNEAEWGYPAQPGLEVRASAQPNAPVIERLGMHFVWVMEDDEKEPPAGAMPMLRVVAPSGKVGYVPADALSPLGNDQICYVKDAGGWKIGGFVGGDE
jgi:hypothetical protein